MFYVCGLLTSGRRSQMHKSLERRMCQKLNSTILCSVVRHHQAKLMVYVVCSCCATSPYREVCRVKGGIGSGETLCHDTYPARPITTVSLATNTYCMMDSHSSCAPRTVGPRVQFSGACEQIHWWLARHTEGGHLLSVVQAATNTERL